MSKPCAIRKCGTGCRLSAKKCSIFRVPADVERYKEWVAVVPGLKQSQFVCERHFEKRFITREWVKYDASGRIIAQTFIEDLQNIYANDEFVKAINIQSAENFEGATSWNEIMLTIHRFALTEAERPVCKNSRNNSVLVAQHGCSVLMRKTVRLATANSGRLLSCNDLMACVFQVLDRKIYKIYHEAYVDILAQHVLTNKIYWLEITAEQWRQTLRIIMKLYKPGSDIPKWVLIDTLRMVVEIGCSQSHLMLDVKKILPFIEEIFHEVNTDKDPALKPLYKLAHVVCQQIGTESRIALCEFGEKVIPSIIGLETCSEKIGLLLILMRIYHPGGSSLDDATTPARNQELWRNVISGIHANVIREIKSKNLPAGFWELCCEVYRQIIQDPTLITEASSSLSDADDEQPRKRRRLAMAVRKPIDLLTINNEVEFEVAGRFIKILTVLLRTYPDSLKPNDYPTFLKTVAEFVEASLKNQPLMDSLCELCTVVVKVEKKYYLKRDRVTNVGACWQKISDIVLRLLSANQNEILGHEFLQSIIEHNNVLDTNEFLHVYLNTQIRWSLSSVETLLMFCLHVPLPGEVPEPKDSANKSKSSTRASLLRWALEIPASDSITDVPPTSVANLLTALAMKFAYKRQYREFRNYRDRADQKTIASVEALQSDLFDNRELKASNDIERCHSAMEFRRDIVEFTEETSKIDEKVSTAVVPEIFELLIANLSKSSTNPVTQKNVASAIVKSTVVAKLMSNFLEMQLKLETSMSRLFDAFAESYKNILSQLLTMENPRCPCLVEAVEALEMFYRTRYHGEISKKIVEMTSTDFVIHIYQFVPEDSDDSENDENCRSINVRDFRAKTNTCRLTYVCRVRNSSHKSLAYFSWIRIDEEMTAMQIRVLKNLMKMHIYEFVKSDDLRRVLIVLKIFDGTEESSKNEESLKIATTFVKNFFDARRRDEIAVRGLLDVLPNFVKSAAIHVVNDDDLLNVLSKIHTLLVKGNYGASVHADFVKCVAVLIRTNPSLKWKIVGAKEKSPVIDIITVYINDPFYIARLEVARGIRVIFSSEAIDVPWKVKYFGKIVSAIANLFVTEDSGESSERIDELAVRTSTSLHILVAIMRSNEFFQSRALYALVELSVRRNVDTEIVKKALLTVTKNETETRRFMELNLYDLLSRWFAAEYELKSFPWILVDCHSQEDFSRRYIDVLLAIKLQRCELREFRILCKNLGISFSQTIERYFPLVMTLLMTMMARRSSESDVANNAEQIFERLRSNIGEFEKIERYKILLEQKLPDIVLDVVTRLNDRQHLYAMLDANVYLPNANSPNFNVEIVDQCLRQLQNELSKNCSLIEYFVTRRPNALQNVLLTLFSDVHDAVTTPNKILAFHRYAYFYATVISEIPLPHFDPMSFYVVRDLAYSLLTLAESEESTVLSEMACSYLLIFFDAVLPARADDVKRILSCVVSRLIPIVQAGRTKSAIAVLRTLMIDRREILQEAVEKCDLFPNEAAFAVVKQVYDGSKYVVESRFGCLEEEIDHFLDAYRDDIAKWNVEELLHMRRILSASKNEINELYGKLVTLHDFHVSSDSHTLHKFVRKLLELARSDRTELSIVAAKCLGEIGPADLTTIILPPSDGCCRESTGQLETLTFEVINRLSDNLVDKNVKLRKTSGDGLRAIFATTWGSVFADKSHLKNFAILCKHASTNVHDCIYPFVTGNEKKSQPIRIDERKWEIFANRSNDPWIPKKWELYGQWITEITCGCLDVFVNFCAEHLKPVCRLSVNFCEMLLPRLLNFVAVTKKSLVNDICDCANRFFRYFVESMKSETIAKISTMSNVAQSYDCVRCMINVVNFMRVQSNERVLPAFDYLFVAKAAQYCSAYFTSILYAELWSEKILRDANLMLKTPEDSRTSPIDRICEYDPESGELLQEIVREAYVRIGDPDCLYGCGFSYLIRSSFKTQYYVHLKQWNKVTLARDVALTCGRNSTRGMLDALQQSGHQYLLKCVINKAHKKMENVDDFMYETAWRLADWSILEPHRPTDAGKYQCRESFDYHASHYRALQSLRDDDMFGLKIALENARMSIVQSLRNPILECSQTLYPILSQLQMLREIEEFATAKPENYKRLLDDWGQQYFTETHDFRYIEPILSQRLVMYEMRNSDANTSIGESTMIDTHLKIAEVAEIQGYLPIAYRVLGNLIRKPDLSEAARDKLTYQKALLDWKEKDHYMGRLVLRNLLTKTNLDLQLRAKALRVYGNWMAETTSESSQDIIKNYYDASIRASTEVNDLKTLMGAQADLAQFADAQYRQIVEFTKTPQYESLVECGKMQNDPDRCSNPGKRAKSSVNEEERRAIFKYERQVANDAAELEDINSSRRTYLFLAMRYYLITLATGNNHDLLVYRMVSLWLDNLSHEDLNEIVRKMLPSVASYKFVTLLPQLAAHMSNVTKKFAVNINNLLERCAIEHPYHSLPILLAAKNTYKDREFESSTKISQKHSKTRPEPRSMAIDALFSKLAKSDIDPIIRETRQLYDALISLARYAVPDTETKKPGNSHRIPKNQAIMKIRDSRFATVPTVTLDVRPDGNYKNIVGINNYEETFELRGENNASKKIICVDNTGKRWRQLLKGQRDLRQDAVLQQVCRTMNSMLKANNETKSRKLRVRTYNIVPLSRRWGVLEWCSNALPMSKILCDTGNIPGLHTKYYPDDWSVSKCRTKLREVRKSSFDVKFKTFLDCCEHLHPAFHHYFMEKYPSAEIWFDKRLSYVRSVATTSIIGYMLGLGDRSCENILIDQTTAEVIHIDYGVAFTEGKVSSTPKTVPFRLTRDMEAAMGICGVEGVMKRSCEQTVTVLRDSRKILITLLQIVIHDPVFMWTSVSPEENDRRGSISGSGRRSTADQSATETNEVAERALLKIEEKLEGMEDAVASSICGQVERLIQEARDPANLCRMTYDWQPYL